MKRINSLDVTKFILSIFVIGLHTLYLIDTPIAHNRLLSTILHIAVPFFFLTSGYLLFRKVEFPLTRNSEKQIWNYMKHIFFLYVIWTLIYLPIAIYGAVISGASIKEFLIYSIRKFLFVGESYYSWNLWYLHGLLLAVGLVFLCFKCKIKPKWIVCLGILVFLAGLGLDNLLGNIESLPSILQKFLRLYLYLFERVRNGIFKGFPYVAIGCFLAQRKSVSLKYTILLLVTGFFIYYNGYEIGFLPFATGFFLLICKLKLKESKCFDYFRNTSILIYLLHMLFIFIYLVLLKRNAVYNPIYLFLFVSLGSLTSATILYFLSRKITCLRKLYGG